MSKSEYNERDFFVEYGIFISRFEEICFAIRMNIQFLLFGENENREINGEVLTEILLEGLTAEPLVKRLYALYVHTYPNDPAGIKLVKSLKDKFTGDIIPIRNSLSHGTTAFGLNLENFESLAPKYFSLLHPKIKSDGHNKGHKIISIDNLKILNENMLKFFDCIQNVISLDKSKQPFYSLATAIIQQNLSNLKFDLESVKMLDDII